MKTILVVDDEAPVREVLRFSLERAGYAVAGATTADSALRELDKCLPDLVVLDLGLPDMSGLELLQNWRQEERTRSLPVIILTGRGGEQERVMGLRTGADDYVTKPFSRGELLARIEAVLRRALPKTVEVVEIAGLRIDSASVRVTAGGHPVQIRPLEFRLLRYFMMQPNRVHTRGEIIDQVWRRKHDVAPRAVDVQVRRLRRLLAQIGYGECIQTVRGMGYRFGEQTDDSCRH